VTIFAATIRRLQCVRKSSNLVVVLSQYITKKVTYHNRQFQCICCTRSVMSSVNQDTPPRWDCNKGVMPTLAWFWGIRFLALNVLNSKLLSLVF